MDNMPRAVKWQNDQLILLDQRKLPNIEEDVVCDSIDQVFDAIKTLTVRGAPAIGIAAAYGVLLGYKGQSAQIISDSFDERADYLISARPTAVNLAWAIERMRDCQKRHHNDEDLYQVLVDEAVAIHEEDKIACHAIGDVGLPLVKAHPNLLTHCNAGSLAVSEMGTALAPMYRAHQEGIRIHVFVDETRPLLQGARLTAYELHRTGIDCTLISDNMAAHVMGEGKVDMVITGADRIAANGDAANKIGTLNLAILCQYYSIPMYIAVPLSTIDMNTASGKDIVIEERDPEEVKSYAGHPVAPVGVAARSPAFDVTPNNLIRGIITDAGLLEPPFDVSIAKVMGGA
ncbi:MAG: S-methyl-5-thioribose-1-phosphate isomerase [Pseudomonadales bacterium]|jgi:methylthioribose-1-phosphate isomerase|nr:S-methyl-5-thioribose-1-phosphate isomerase [Pseudomonadales bacterium]